MSAICAMSTEGMLDSYITTGADTFEDFVVTSLSSKIQPFDGTRPNSVVVMDNCSVHHVDTVSSSLLPGPKSN